jgi:hypothetical protein
VALRLLLVVVVVANITPAELGPEALLQAELPMRLAEQVAEHQVTPAAAVAAELTAPPELAIAALEATVQMVVIFRVFMLHCI